MLATSTEMVGGADIVDALSQPLRAFFDPGKRVFWLFLASSAAMPWLLIGLRRGTRAVRDGLLARALWSSASSRADITLVFAKAMLSAVVRVPWLASTAGAAVWVGLTLHAWLGPPDVPQLSRASIAVLYSLTLFVGWDLGRFVLHWLMHRVSVLWAFHQVHHSARVLTPLTLYRAHPVETLLYELRGLITTATITGGFAYVFAGQATAVEFLGISALGFLFNLAGGNLRHSHVWLRYGRVERWLISPAQHQLHHARDHHAQTHNFGTWLAVWDRLAGTWCPAPNEAPEAYGVDDANHRFDSAGSMLLGPLLAVVRALGRRRRGQLSAVAVFGLLGARNASAAPSELAPQPPGAEPTVTLTTAPDAPPQDPPPATDAISPQADTPPPDAAGPTSAGAAAPPDETTSAGAAAPPTDTVSAGADAPPDATSPGAASLQPHALSPNTTTAPQTDAASSPSAQTAVASPPPPAVEGESEDIVRNIVVGSMFDASELPRVAGSAHAISEQALERHEYDNIHDVLAEVPGVYVRGEDGYGLRPNIGLRGANPDRSAKITLLEDGVLLGPAPYSAPAAYYFPLVTRMVGVEVFKGPASIRYGPSTIGGAINQRTREIPDRHTSVVDLAGGRFGYVKGHGYYGTTYKGFGVLVEAARVQTTGFKDLDGGGDTGFAKNDSMIKLGYETPQGRRVSHDVEVKLGLATENSNETYLGITDEDFKTTPYRRYAASAGDNMAWWRSQAELTYVLRQGDTIEVEARVYRHDFQRVWRRLDTVRGAPPLADVLADPEGGGVALGAALASLRGEQDSLPNQAVLTTNNDRRFVSQGVQTALRWRQRWGIVKQDLELGARLHNDSIERDHTEDAFAMISGVRVPDGTEAVQRVRNRGETVAAAFHVYDVITLWDRLTLAPGMRVEVISSAFTNALIDTQQRRRLDTALGPGFGALVLAQPWLGIFVGVHRGFAPVTPGQPEDLEPEISVNYEAGARARSKGLSGEVVGFASDYSNLNASCTFSAGCSGDGTQGVSAGAVFVWGVESLVRYRHRLDSGFVFEVGGTYTYTGSRFANSFSSSFSQWGDVQQGDELPYVPRHLAGGTFGVGGRIWDVSASPKFHGRMRDVAGRGAIPSRERIDGFFLLDVSAEVRVLERFRIYSQIGNATNSRYITSRRPFGIRPGAPLTFMFGVKAHILP